MQATETMTVPTPQPVIHTPTLTKTAVSPTSAPPILYTTQAGDTLPSLAVRFNVNVDEIESPELLPEFGLLDPNILLIIPDRLDQIGPPDHLIPDSEVVYSPSAIDFDIETFVVNAGGYLSTYTEHMSNGNLSGAQVVQRVAIENSINPRLLLSILEYQSHWVYGQPRNIAETDYPIGYKNLLKKGLYHQLSWAVSQLSLGYYGWRAGLVTELAFSNNDTIRLAPDLNAGTVAVQFLFSKLYDQRNWGGVLYSPGSLPELHQQMFESPWLRAQLVEPLYPTTLTQPALVLPFQPKTVWSLTGGPHSAWGPDGALAALDFAPASESHGCTESIDWVTASAAGLVVRSGNGIVMVDMDGDGHEQTGWAMLYLHIASKDRVAEGVWLNTNDRIGHPSCEGGSSTGTHVHVARKFNGEWILADGPMPFNLSNWIAKNGSEPYQGWLIKEDVLVRASMVGEFDSRIIRVE
ncbi:MAG: hypothetical protein HPY76_15170 [Anaerolineae bacterium]|nr:hypothetical protein [Anaerolineae bacterium]NPV57994.1 hypothetical protein [Anaerolineae bacterium]